MMMMPRVYKPYSGYVVSGDRSRLGWNIREIFGSKVTYPELTFE